jgi:signal transduction histidine kinase
MQGNIEAMIDGVFIPSKERLENLKLDIERLSRLVYDVEKIVSNDNKNQVIKYKYDVVNEVNNILKTFEKEIISKKIVVNFTNKNKCLIFANKDKMNQVIINLISNAIKYTDENGK